MSKYILCGISALKENNAGSKAGNDALEIAQKCGYTFIPLYKKSKTKTKIINIISGLFNTRKLISKLQNDDIVLLQYPTNRFLMGYIYRKLKKCKVNIYIITLIHDIDYLRDVSLRKKGVQGMREKEISLLESSDYLICHNKFMVDRLKKENIRVKFVSLQIFDYLYSGKAATIIQNQMKIVVAGNLHENKAGYLYKINNKQHHFNLCLYGANYNPEKIHYSCVEYRGIFQPDKLIENLQGTYGLVWDGDSTKVCSGSYGKYLKFNNPHKVSLYIAAGLPVIIWKKAALCQFIEKNHLGFGINSIDELDKELGAHRDKYQLYLENISKLREKVCQGYFLKRALQEVENDTKYGDAK